MKCITAVPLMAENIVTTAISDAQLGIVKIDIDNDFDYSTISSMYLEVYASCSLTGQVNTNQAIVKMYDKTNSADVTSGGITLSAPISLGIYQSSDCKSYFNGKGEIEIHLKTSEQNAELNLWTARLVIVLDGDVTKFVTWHLAGYKLTDSEARTGYEYCNGHVLHTSGNWDGTATTTYQCTLWKQGDGATAYSKLYDGTNDKGEVSTTNATPTALESSSITLSDATEYYAGCYEDMNGGREPRTELRLPLIVRKISGSFTKFEIENAIFCGVSIDCTTEDTWVELSYGVEWDASLWDDCTLTHYHEGVGYTTLTGTTKKTCLTDDGTEDSNTEIDWNSTTSVDRLRSSSFTAWSGSSEMTCSYYEDGNGYQRHYLIKHLILVTNAINGGTNIQLNISDDWKSVDAMQINIGDTWKEVAGAQINIGDSWKTIF